MFNPAQPVAGLAYDTTNFYTYIASNNRRNQLAQRSHNKQGRHNLRQVGLSYVMDGENGLSLCHHVYPGNVADGEEFSTTLTRITRMLDQNQIGRETVTLAFQFAAEYSFRSKARPAARDSDFKHRVLGR